MPILVTCECGKQFQTSDENAGRRARCPDCGRELIIPQPGESAVEGPGGKPFGPPPEGAEFAPVGEERTSGKAIASLVLGILSFFGCCLLTGIPAIIFGMLGINEVNASRGRVTGKGIAIAGIITGIFGSLLLSLVMAAMMIPAVQAAREAARRAQCTNNLKQIGLAMHNYHDVNNALPPAAITDKDGKPLLSWRVAILPFIDQQNLYDQFHLDEPWDSPHNKALLSQMPATYRCPSEPEGDRTVTTYVVFDGPGALFDPEGNDPGKGTSFREITDGTSNTLMVVESKNAVPWTKPEDLPFDPNGPRPAVGSKHPGGFNALMGDGAVRFIKTSVADSVLKALITRAGNEVISPDAF